MSIRKELLDCNLRERDRERGEGIMEMGKDFLLLLSFCDWIA